MRDEYPAVLATCAAARGPLLDIRAVHGDCWTFRHIYSCAPQGG